MKMQASCVECGATILASTAQSNGGKCIPCARGTRGQMERNKRWMAEQRERRRRNDAAMERIRGEAHPAFEDFLAEEDPVGVLWPFLVATVFRDDQSKAGIAALSPGARTLYLVQVLGGEVLNGGFEQYFSNSSGEYAHETLAALQEVGASQAAKLLEQAIAAFPGGQVPTQRLARYEALQKVNAEVLEALDTAYYRLEKTTGEDLSERILAFMRNHAADRVVA